MHELLILHESNKHYAHKTDDNTEERHEDKSARVS